MPSKHYFDPKVFIQTVLKDCKLGDASPALLEKLEQKVEQRLSERIIAVIFSEFGDREFTLLEKVLEDHPEINDYDAIAMIAPSIPGVQERLEKGIQDLHDELTTDAAEIENQMKIRDARAALGSA